MRLFLELLPFILFAAAMLSLVVVYRRASKNHS